MQDCELRLHSIGWLNDTSLLLSGDDADEPGRSILMLAFWDDASGGSPHLREQFGRESGIAEPSQGPAMHFAIVPEWHLTFASDARLETAFVHALGRFIVPTTFVAEQACVLEQSVACIW